MNESTIIQLKVLVERVVRPIRASAECKRRMRDELLVHATATFEQEFAKLGSESAALEQTAARLGDPADLTRQLQESISIVDRFKAFAERIWSRPGEPWAVRAIRQGMLINMLMIAFLLVPWLASGAPTSGFSIRTFQLVAPILLVLVIAALLFPFAVEWMFRAIYGPRGRSWNNIALLTLVCGAGFVALGLWLDASDLIGLALAAGFGLIWTPISLACMANAAAIQLRYQQEWEGLAV